MAYTPTSSFTFSGTAYTPTSTFVFGGAQYAQKSKSADLGAALVQGRTKQADLNAALGFHQEKTADLDAAVNAPLRTASFDAALAATISKQADLGAALAEAKTRAADLDAAINAPLSAATLDAGLVAEKSRQADLNAALIQAKTRAADLDAAVNPPVLAATLDAAVNAPLLLASLGAAVQQAKTRSADLDAAVNPPVLLASLNAAVQEPKTRAADLSAALVQSMTRTAGLDAEVEEIPPVELSAGLNAVLWTTVELPAGLNAWAYNARTRSADLDVAINASLLTAALDAARVAARALQAELDLGLFESRTRPADLDAALIAPARTVSAGLGAEFLPRAGEPIDTTVLALLHCDGAGNTFTDATGRTWTAYGDVTQSSDQSKFGGVAGYCASGSGGYLETAESSALNFDNVPFTFEGFFRFYNTSTRLLMGSGSNATGSWALLRYGNYIYFTVGASLRASRSATFNTSDWFHVAVTRNESGVCKVWVNGVGSTAGNYTTYTGPVNANGGLVIGKNAAWNAYSPTYWRGYFDEIRISNTCKYTSDFTPPSEPFVIRAPRTTFPALLDADLIATYTRSAAISAEFADRHKLNTFPDAWLWKPSVEAVVERRVQTRLDVNLLPPLKAMSLSFSTGLRNYLLGNYAQITGNGLGGAMQNCFIDLYTGSKPASPDYPPLPGTLIGTFQLSENPYNDEWGGSWEPPTNAYIRKRSWQKWVMQALKDGTAGWFRMRLLDDPNTLSTTHRRIDGTVGTTVDHDMRVRSTTFVKGRSYTIDEFRMMMRMVN